MQNSRTSMLVIYNILPKPNHFQQNITCNRNITALCFASIKFLNRKIESSKNVQFISPINLGN